MALAHQYVHEAKPLFEERLRRLFTLASSPPALLELDVLGLLRSMYALICIEEDACFLRYGHLSLDNAAAVRNEVMKLCREIRPHALAVVNSFGIPDSFLGPIAFDWVDANSWAGSMTT